MAPRPLAKDVRPSPYVELRCVCGTVYGTRRSKPSPLCEVCRRRKSDPTSYYRNGYTKDGHKARFAGMRTEDHHLYKTDAEAKKKTVRGRLGKRYPDAVCAVCQKRGKQGPRVVFVDGDYRNTDPSNLLWLCFSHWLDRTGRREQHAEANRNRVRELVPMHHCANCGKPGRIKPGSECHTCTVYRSLYKKIRPARLFRPEKGEGLPCKGS